jgi:hypothetical protein
MTLLTTVFAAAISTVVWYKHAPESKMMTGVLPLMYWGASLMWLVDAAVEYLEVGAEFFEPDPPSMLNDLYLGLSVVALGLIIWIIILLVKDPKGSIRATLFKKNV